MNKLITYDKIINCNPDYDFQEIGMPTNYEDTVINFINEYRHKVESLYDIFWVIRKLDLFTTKQYQWFALKCAKMIKHLLKDERSIKALEIIEAYLLGNATKEKLEIAKNNAYDAYIAATIDIHNADEADNDEAVCNAIEICSVNDIAHEIVCSVFVDVNYCSFDFEMAFIFAIDYVVYNDNYVAKLEIRNKLIDLIIDILNKE